MPLEELSGKDPSVEVLLAHGVEDTLEKLGRNRRVDAVLLLEVGDAAAAIVGAIEEDSPAHPPVFQPAGRPPIPGTRILAAREPSRLMDLLLAELEG